MSCSHSAQEALKEPDDATAALTAVTDGSDEEELPAVRSAVRGMRGSVSQSSSSDEGA